jgi:hypothetical protein
MIESGESENIFQKAILEQVRTREGPSRTGQGTGAACAHPLPAHCTNLLVSLKAWHVTCLWACVLVGRAAVA